LTQTILRGDGVRIERIVSHGHRSPDGFWYDQAEREWVLLISGRARLRFEGEEAIELSPGDYVDIPAHRRHRVEWTEPNAATIWLAVFSRS
jgi:cupin 2 domain-containing protein